MNEVTEKISSNAYLRDGALILHFDMAETPFVSRFNLESLAQANFEIADKKDGFYSLVLRDYSGDVQTIGQFSTKGDAHNALHAILKALLSETETKKGKSCKGKWGCFIRGVIKFLLAIIAILVALYIVAILRVYFMRSPAGTPVVQGQPIPQAPVAEAPPAKLPQGEAVDADDFLKQAAPAPTPATPMAELPKP